MKPHLVCVGGEDHALRVPFFMELRERGFQITAVSTCDGASFRRYAISHRRYEFDRFSSGSGKAGAIRTLRGLIAELRPDILQSFDTKPNLLAPLAARGRVPVVRTINGLGWTFSSLALRALMLRPLFIGLQRLASHWTAATVFQNRDDQNFFQRYRLLGHGANCLIPGSGIDIGAFAAAQHLGPPAARLREEFGLESAEVIMFVGRLTRQKGIPTLLKAVPKVLARRPNARFVLIGPWQSEGPFAVAESEISQLGPNVVVVGKRSDIPALLSMADVFAFPTEYREGVPRVLLEAALAGLPIVASRMPGCTDVVQDGWNGHLVPPRDPDALANRIIDLLADRQRAVNMGSRSVDLVRERFALPGVVDQYCDLYREILAARSNGAPTPSILAHRVANGRLGESRR
ncbi:Glycosyl transferase group 1 [Mesorhizobium sp. ORS 3359]|nr:Glycosyl transferase group 1 [Mesorhizobium sp. ORS 3359]